MGSSGDCTLGSYGVDMISFATAKFKRDDKFSTIVEIAKPMSRMLLCYSKVALIDIVRHLPSESNRTSRNECMSPIMRS